MHKEKNILVAPLNWGLGHATRCIPIIKKLIEQNYNPILASDGDALSLLRKEFPDLNYTYLPSYGIKYAKKGKNFKGQMALNSPKIALAIIQENIRLKKIIKQYQIDGVISDNRLGLFTQKVPSIFISHQLNVLSGKTTKISSKIHQFFINKFDECWVPDLKNELNLSGNLGHLNQPNLNLKYIGPISRFEKKDCSTQYDYLVLLSGPEPQRSILEKKLFDAVKKTNKNILFIRGKVEEKQKKSTLENISIYNYMTSEELEEAVNKSALIIARSGYTTIMDLVKLEKRAFFIPTPGQYEQEYLAYRLNELKLAPYCNQESFSIEQLNQAALYKGFSSLNFKTDFKTLFGIFEDSKNYSSAGAVAFSKVKENSDPTPNSLST